MDDISRQRWSSDALKLFLETCIEEVARIGRSNNSLRKESWDILAVKMKEGCNMTLSQRQLKNQYDYLKARYSSWSYLKNRTGNIYDASTNTFNISNQEWDDFSKGHPKLKSLKNAPLQFPELCTALFEGMSASGTRAWGPSSSFMRSGASSSSFNSQIQILEPEDEQESDPNINTQDSQVAFSTPMPTQDHPNVNVNPSHVEVTSEHPSQATSMPNKKRKKDNIKKKDKLDSLIEVAATALVSIADRRHKKETSDACVAKLNTLGLDEMDPLYINAFLIFANSTLQQDFWLQLPDKPEVLKAWLEKTSRTLGFL